MPLFGISRATSNFTSSAAICYIAQFLVFVFLGHANTQVTDLAPPPHFLGWHVFIG